MHTMMQNAADTADFVFSIAGADTNDLRVTSIAGDEMLGRLFHFRVELVSDEPRLDLRAMVGQPCMLRIAGENGQRYVHGIVRSMQRVGEGSRLTHYAVEIVPPHWILTRRRGCRIFQQHNCADMSVPGIIQKALALAGIPADQLRLALSREYQPREYVVQYRETDLDFIARLMEHEGIFYSFEHTEAGVTMVLGDSPVAHPSVEGESEIRFRANSGLEAEHECVFNVRDREEVNYGKVSLDDFNYEAPPMDADMVCSRQAGQFGGLEFHDYPGGHEDRPAGDIYAQIRLEEFQCAREMLEMKCTARNLLPGARFTLIEHPVEELNAEYVVVSVSHRAMQPQSAENEAGRVQEVGYEATIRAIPACVPFRPARTTPRPIIAGAQTAIVVGPKSEEIYTDDLGRVKVQFHWDREGMYDERSSCWIRVSQAWAGGQYGAQFLPRVGHEVIVSFLEGDPDRPIITGRVYNADLTPIFDAKQKMCSGFWSQSTKGGDGCSAIVFDDTKDEEMLYLHSQRDLELTAECHHSERCGRSRDTIIGRNRRELIMRRHQAEIRLDHDEKIGGNKSQQIGGSLAVSVGGAHAETCGSYWLNSGKGEVVIESAAGITLKVGGSFIKIHGGGVDIMGTVVNINSGGSASNGVGAPFGEFQEVYEAEYAEPPGYDISYNKNPREPAEGDDGEDGASQENTEDETPMSWIEIELVDEAGQPWPGETYEVTEPCGTVHRGALDANGRAYVPVKAPGLCTITFPKLDMDAWTRA